MYNPFTIASFVALRCHPKQFALPKAIQTSISKMSIFVFFYTKQDILIIIDLTLKTQSLTSNIFKKLVQ